MDVFSQIFGSDPYSTKQVPVHHKTPPPRKVVTIPVTDVSERPLPTRSDSAVKIQKLLRGYLVRKSVKKICEINSEVVEIEKRISMNETVEELLKKDSKERLKINEMLMRLLLRLDCVRGVDSGVRDFRRSVIKRTIRLQELVDSIVSNNNVEDSSNQSLGTQENVNSNDTLPDCVYTVNEVVEEEAEEELSEIRKSVSECIEMSSDGSEADSSDSLKKQQPDDTEKEVVENDEKDQDQDQDQCEGNNKVENEKSKELLEKMMEDNEKMMGLMAKLFERNEMQTRLLSSLSHRVEQLEKALLCEKKSKIKNKKKKRHSSAGVADCLESTHDCKRSPANR